MSRQSPIEWTNSTWNPVTGCTKVSAGCDHCYAERLSERFRGVEGHPFETGFDLTLRPKRLEQPMQWRRPQLIFVNSMSDLFHKNIPTEYIERVFDTMERADWHIYQVLTKRSSLMRRFVQERYPSTGASASSAHRSGHRRGQAAPPHIWLGVSVENHAALTRLRHLQQTNASVRFVSFGAVAWSNRRGGFGGYSLGNRRGGERAGSAAGANRMGCGPCATSVRPSASPSSLSNGVGAHRKRAGIRSMDGSGWSIRQWRQVRGWWAVTSGWCACRKRAEGGCRPLGAKTEFGPIQEMEPF